MVQGNAILVVDLGNSSTKCKVLFNKDSKTGKFRVRKFDLPNIFAPLPENYEISSDYSEENSMCLRCEAEIDGNEINGIFCSGELQSRERPMTAIKPSAKVKKYLLDSTPISYRCAFVKAFQAIMDIQKVSDVSQLDITWTVVTLLPPGDIKAGAGKIAEIVSNITRVDSILPELSAPVKISHVQVFPEGFCAYVGTVYDTGSVIRPDYEFLLNETVLIADIGAGTTDFVVVRKNGLVQNSLYTIDQGGNNVLRHVDRSLKFEGLILDDTEVREGVLTGKVRDGATERDITGLVNDARREIATKLINGFQDYIEDTDLNMRSIGYVLVCGGGASDGDNPDLVPIGSYIIENIKRLSKNTELIKLPKHTVTRETEDGDVYKTEAELNPRELNLLGASIMAETLI